MNIKDVNGKEHGVEVAFYTGLAIVVHTVPLGMPISSRIILDTGEIRAKMVDINFRGNKDLDSLVFQGLHAALRKGALPATSGSIFGFVHAEHGSNKLMPLYGAKPEPMEKDGVKWNKWSVSVVDMLSGNV